MTMAHRRNARMTAILLATAMVLVTTASTAAVTIATVSMAAPASAAVPAAGTPDSASPSISANGRYVAFSSVAPNLVAGDTNQRSDVFVRDRVARTTTLVSVSSPGVQGDGSSYHPVISGDGHSVVFESDATNLVVGDTNGIPDLFVRDLVHHTTTRVDVSTNGVQQPFQPSPPQYPHSVSNNGRYIVFEAGGGTLVPGSPSDMSDVFVRDTVENTTSQVSVSAAGVPADGLTGESEISGNGRYVVFESAAHNLVPGQTITSDLYVKDLRTGAVSGLTLTSDGKPASGEFPSISDSGRYVEFQSAASALAPNGAHHPEDVYIRDRTAGITKLVSASPSGASGNNDSGGGRVSGDGRYVAFTSEATNLVPHDTNREFDVFLRDIASATTTRISVSAAGAQADNQSGGASITGDGTAVAFASYADDLVGSDTNGGQDVFVRTVADATTARVSLADNGDQSRNCFWDGDDAVVGMPGYIGGAGGVDVHSISTGDTVLTRTNIGAGVSTAGDHFGAAVASDDLQATAYNGDPNLTDPQGGCESVAIGAPGADGSGRVYIAFSSDAGPAGNHDVATLTDPHAQPGEEFGAALLIVRQPQSSVSDVWVGVPGKDVGSAVDAGAVEHFRVSYDKSATRATVTYVATLTQDSPHVVGTAETGDHFGEVLSSNIGIRGYSGYLGVGVPDEDVGAARDAGMVDVIPLDSTTGYTGISQSSPGMPGTAEAGDRFGAALDGACDGIVGVPGEDLGAIRDAGAAESYTGCGKTFKAGKLLTEDSPGIPGTAEAGDQFGATVATNNGSITGAIYYGVPGKDIGSVRDAGAVLVVPVGCPDGATVCPLPPRLIWQGHGVPGTAEAGALLGASLATRFGPTGGESGPVCDVIVGAPGEAVDGLAGAGAVYANLNSDLSGPRTIGLSTGARAGVHYGAVLGTDLSGHANTG